MKKALAFTLVLFALGVGGMCRAHIQVNAPREQVVITETVLQGDKAAAQGLTVDTHINYSDCLFWDTSFVVGETSSASTDYSFVPINGPLTTPPVYEGVTLDSYFSPVARFTFDEDSTGLATAYQGLFDSLSPGEEGSSLVYLKDYYDFYPFGGAIDLPGYPLKWAADYDSNRAALDAYGIKSKTDQQTLLALQDFFKIPVPEEESFFITVEKDTAGAYNFPDIQLRSCDYFDFMTVNVLTDTACYFTFDCHTKKGNLVDTSFIPGGYGIYCLPYAAHENGSGGVGPLSTVYPLPTDGLVLALDVNPAQTKLLIHSVEDGRYILTVVDLDTMATLQRLELGDWTSEFDRLRIDWGDDFFVSQTEEQRFFLVAVTDTGEYDLRILREEPLAGEAIAGLTFAYDGQRLAVADLNDCDVHLAVYDPSGLLYQAEYASTLSVQMLLESYRSPYNWPVTQNPFSIRWN